MVNPSQASAGSAQGGTGDGGEAELSWPLTTWQGWRRFATTDPPTLPPGDPPRSTEERLAYHSAFVTIRTAIHTLALAASGHRSAAVGSGRAAHPAWPRR